MHRLRCAEIWGGIGNQDQDLCSAGVVASLHSNAFDGSEGGDIYYLSVCENDELTRIAIADVAGHGKQVTDVSRWLYRILEAHMTDTRCDKILAELNRVAIEYGIKALTTASVVGFYTENRNLYFAYAGHAPVLLKRNGEVAWQPLELDAVSTIHANAPLGVVPQARFDQHQVPLQPGDRLFLYTDGLTESKNHEREPFGSDRLRRALSEADGRSLADVKITVLDTLSRHLGGSRIQDDLTLLAVEVQ